jgi:hypothetical protein
LYVLYHLFTGAKGKKKQTQLELSLILKRVLSMRFILILSSSEYGLKGAAGLVKNFTFIKHKTDNENETV